MLAARASSGLASCERTPEFAEGERVKRGVHARDVGVVGAFQLEGTSLEVKVEMYWLGSVGEIWC